jgi:hypothetical protein
MSESEQLRVWVARAQQGDPEAFGSIVRRFQDMAVGYAASRLGDFDLAEDAAQEAFLEAWRDLPRLREPAAFSSWLRRIVRGPGDPGARGGGRVTEAGASGPRSDPPEVDDPAVLCYPVAGAFSTFSRPAGRAPDRAALSSIRPGFTGEPR